MMHLEDGPEASPFPESNGKKIERQDSYETGFTGFNENDTNHRFRGLPNVIGIVRK